MFSSSCIKNFFFFLIICLSLFSIQSFSQVKNYTVANAHAHNDYMHPVPFYTAYNAGFGSIEADVFLVNGVLLVAHSKNAIQAKNTLEHLYLAPLLQELKNNKNRKVRLLIDIKQNYKLSLQLLIKELEPLKKYLFTYSDRNKP